MPSVKAKVRCQHGRIWFQACEACDRAERLMLFEADKRARIAAVTYVQPEYVGRFDSERGWVDGPHDRDRIAIRYLREWDIETVWSHRMDD